MGKSLSPFIPIHPTCPDIDKYNGLVIVKSCVVFFLHLKSGTVHLWDMLTFLYKLIEVYQGCHGHGKSWIFWNFEIFWNFWKSHGILTKNKQGHGKVIEFLNWGKKSWKNHGIVQINS